MPHRVLLGCLLTLGLPACASDDAGGGTGGTGAMPAGAGATGGSTAANGGSGAAAGAVANGGSSGVATGGSSGVPTAGATSGGVGGTAGVAGTGGSAGSGGAPAGAGGGAGVSALGGMAGLGGEGGVGMPGGAAGSGAGAAGAAGGCTTDCGPPLVVTYPMPPGAVVSPLYTVKVNGQSLFVEKLTKYAPEMQIHYAHASLSAIDAADVEVTVGEAFSAYTVSPKSRNLAVTKSDRTIKFSTGPNYLILQFDTKELLFVLLDDAEVNPPKLGDANVKDITDYGVDATGAALQTTKIQAAIDAASGAAQNILYFPPGKYLIGELWLKSDMTLYLAGGALLYGSGATGDFNTGSGGIDIEGCSHGVIRMYKIQNAKVLGRGVIDGNGVAVRAQNDTKINLFKIEQSTGILVDGILVRDPSFWNTLVYRSDQVTFQNYKMLNCRPTTTTYNNTDGVNFDESTNGKLYNALLYTGDDSMATKNEEASGTVNTKNILHEKVVAYSNSVGCKIGTKTMGQTIDNVVFKDIDVVKAGRALNIDAYDTAVVQNTRFENIRVEAADTSLIALEETDPPTWRDAANQSIIKDTYFYDITSSGPKLINLHAKSTQYGIDGVHFKNVVINGQPLTTQTDTDATWSINSFVTRITFDP